MTLILNRDLDSTKMCLRIATKNSVDQAIQIRSRRGECTGFLTTHQHT